MKGGPAGDRDLACSPDGYPCWAASMKGGPTGMAGDAPVGRRRRASRRGPPPPRRWCRRRWCHGPPSGRRTAETIPRLRSRHPAVPESPRVPHRPSASVSRSLYAFRERPARSPGFAVTVPRPPWSGDRGVRRPGQVALRLVATGVGYGTLPPPTLRPGESTLVFPYLYPPMPANSRPARGVRPSTW